MLYFTSWHPPWQRPSTVIQCQSNNRALNYDTIHLPSSQQQGTLLAFSLCCWSALQPWSFCDRKFWETGSVTCHGKEPGGRKAGPEAKGNGKGLDTQKETLWIVGFWRTEGIKSSWRGCVQVTWHLRYKAWNFWPESCFRSFAWTCGILLLLRECSLLKLWKKTPHADSCVLLTVKLADLILPSCLLHEHFYEHSSQKF